MNLYCLLIVLSLAQYVLGQNQTVIDSFTTANLAPDIYSPAPDAPLLVKYNGALVNLGNRIPTRTTKNEPTVLFPAADSTKLYTLLAYDADALDTIGPLGSVVCNNKNLPTLLWRVNNISGDKVAEGETSVSYMGPLEGGHRIVFYFFQQSFGVDGSPLDSLTTVRACSNVKEYASQNSLTLVAGNYFRSV